MKKPSRTAERERVGGFAARPVDDVPAPARDAARRRIRSKPGFFASLGATARSAILGYDGPEVMGPPRGDRAG